ncbi:hypothetical protein PUN28_020264 [Cardiocondyla obscurior]|uniref:Ribosomal protein L22 n=1 Tax=Cardiocondyla obscurior TaxID=286306 RepID=A0AAW2E7Z0_9HYME
MRRHVPETSIRLLRAIHVAKKETEEAARVSVRKG